MYLESEDRIVYCCKKMKKYFENKYIYFSKTQKKVCLDFALDDEQYDCNVESGQEDEIDFCPFCGKKILIK